ncbi:MAG: carboxylating nicotinate-nucleotide diphosphorylase [Pirellulales bacterium]
MTDGCGVRYDDVLLGVVEVMATDYKQIEWDEKVADDCRQLIRLAVREDLDRSFDLTSVALFASDATGSAKVVARQDGLIAGLPAVELVLAEMDTRTRLVSAAEDGEAIVAGQSVATIEGATRDILTSERIILNFLGRLSGIATLTRRYVEAVANEKANIYDTRKTTPGWRRLEKYAVRCGGGRNHRTGLFDAVLIKDNHLASDVSPAVAVCRAREFLAEQFPDADGERPLVEIEVDSLSQLSAVLPHGPDVILLDNMMPDELRQAVAIRDASPSSVELEASGGVNLQTVGEIAKTGIERISVGAVTHSAVALDFGLDWKLS